MPEWTARGEERYKMMARQGHGFSTSRSVKVLKTHPETNVQAEVLHNGSDMGEIAIQGNIVMK